MKVDRTLVVSVFFLFISTFCPLPGNPLATESHHQGMDYLRYVKDATEFASEEYYDYIVVGGGTAGCPLAATLSEHHSVLVLERGPAPHAQPQVFRSEKFFTNLVEVNDVDSPAEAFNSEDGVPNVRPRVLGGGTMINAGFYSRGNEEFYAEWGIEWDRDLAEESYKWVEDTIVFQPDMNTWRSSAKEALLDAGNGPYRGFSLDHVEGVKLGGSIFDSTGRRHGAVELLSKGNPINLKVGVQATVERIIFHSSESTGLSAVGVIYSDSTGRIHGAMLRAKGEVILSAGALGSTHLLLLSGVGPHSYLSSLNISVVHSQPFVGQFLFDLPRNEINIIPPFPLDGGGIALVGITKKGYYIEAMSGIFPFYSPPAFFLFPEPSPPVSFPVLTLFEKLAKAAPTGSLHLESPVDVRVRPKVRFNYFSDPKDLATCVQGMRNIERAMDSPAMEKYKFRDPEGNHCFKFAGRAFPENKTDDASMEEFCRKTVLTIWHYHGGCVVGKVVDKDLKVMGINALRVVDGSTFTSSPGTNPQATLMMLGRYMGVKIGQERKKLAADI